MENKAKRIISAILAVFVFACPFMMLSCGGTGTSSGSEDAFICKKSDFDGIKDGISKNGKLSGKALERSVDKLVVNETYYFVYAFSLYDKNQTNGDRVFSAYSFNIKNTSGSYDEYEAISFGGVESGGLESVKKGGYSVTAEAYSGSSALDGFIAVEFTPLKTGTVYASSVTSRVINTSMNDVESDSSVCASVFESADDAEKASEVTVSGLEYEMLTDGKEYLNVSFDMDVTKVSGNDEAIYCVIHMRKGVLTEGSWDSAVIESANTGKFFNMESEYGKIMVFEYNINAMGKKSAEISISFDTLDRMDVNIYLFSDEAALTGDLYTEYYEDYLT